MKSFNQGPRNWIVAFRMKSIIWSINLNFMKPKLPYCSFLESASNAISVGIYKNGKRNRISNQIYYFTWTILWNMNDIQSLFQAHRETFWTFIFHFHSNLKLLCQIQIHLTYAPSNVKRVELCVSMLSACARMKVVSWIIFALDPTPNPNMLKIFIL